MNQIPVSAVPVRVGLAGLLGATTAFLLIFVLQLSSLVSIIFLLMSCALPMWWLERRRQPTGGRIVRDAQVIAPPNLRQRLLGVGGVVGLFAVCIGTQLWLAPDWVGGLYAWTLPALPVVGTWTIWHLLKPVDPASSVDQLGAALVRTLQVKRLDASAQQLILAWLVKAFFLPLMLAWSYAWLARASDELSIGENWMTCFVVGMAWLYAIDTAFGTIGYMSTSERIGAQIRSVDATPLGWLSALVCYPPLSLLVLRQWLEYKDGLEWQSWLQTAWLSVPWGLAILLLTAGYTWATVAFGPRFSNLTNRGIITSGPYRYSKHPAYICKNLSWWLISVPFVSTAGTTAALLNCLALCGVNAIYWLRAKTEERHLMHDETYRQYAAWIAEHGIIGQCRRIVARTGR